MLVAQVSQVQFLVVVVCVGRECVCLWEWVGGVVVVVARYQGLVE